MRVLGIDLWQVLFSVIGGVTFLFFGMELLSGGLRAIAGDSMKKLLQFFSRNKLTAVLAGTFVTAIIQSSSATTVMVLGFINAGLINLQQAIGIIFGANVGTTVTAQLISFNLDNLAVPCIVAGFILTMIKKRDLKGWGKSIFGFGLIFFGMTMMRSELQNLQAFPTILKFFEDINCAPVPGGRFMPLPQILCAIGIGIVSTALLQASSAVIGILLALSVSGLLNFYTAVPILIGTNIGTTITSWAAAATANRVAKQAALAHTLFNTIGAAIMVGFFYILYHGQPVFLYFINFITPGDVFAEVPQNLGHHIAMAHTLFNIITVLCIMPCLGVFSRLCEILIPVRT